MVLTKEFVQLRGTENSAYLDVLRLFAHGTWSDYKSKYTKFYFVKPFFIFPLYFLLLSIPCFDFQCICIVFYYSFSFLQ